MVDAVKPVFILAVIVPKCCILISGNFRTNAQINSNILNKNFIFYFKFQ